MWEPATVLAKAACGKDNGEWQGETGKGGDVSYYRFHLGPGQTRPKSKAKIGTAICLGRNLGLSH
jgi:hypothetical protein